MARTLIHYTATAVGGATFYCYAQPDESSRATRLSNGDALVLPSWYANEITGGMLRITQPKNGWIFSCNVSGIQPVYATTVDPCTAPSLVALNASTRLLTITGGAGGDLNTLTGFGISWRDRDLNSAEWGSWTTDTITTKSTFTVTAPASGKVRQFRVRTRGSAGSSYFSSYVSCKTLLSGNTVVTPVILFPVSGSVSQSPAPWLIVYCPPDPDTETQNVYVQIDGGEWEHLTECDPGEITESHSQLLDLSPGKHTVAVRMEDASGGVSPVDSTLFTMKAFEWNRPIASGDIISNQKVSHRADLLEMLDSLNVLRAYYGLPPIARLPGYVGRFSDWPAQIEALKEGINDVRALKGESGLLLGSSNWPKASIINRLRETILDS